MTFRIGCTVSEAAWNLLNEKYTDRFRGGVRKTLYDLICNDDLNIDSDLIEEVACSGCPKDSSKPLAYFHSPGKYCWSLLTLNRACFPELFN